MSLLDRAHPALSGSLFCPRYLPRLRPSPGARQPFHHPFPTADIDNCRIESDTAWNLFRYTRTQGDGRRLIGAHAYTPKIQTNILDLPAKAGLRRTGHGYCGACFQSQFQEVYCSTLFALHRSTMMLAAIICLGALCLWAAVVRIWTESGGSDALLHRSSDEAHGQHQDTDKPIGSGPADTV